VANSSRNRSNQPPTGQDTRQSPAGGEPRKVAKRSDVVQAQRHHPELNLGDRDEDEPGRGQGRTPGHRKAGRQDG
jgi:hypothetical protein